MIVVWLTVSEVEQTLNELHATIHEEFNERRDKAIAKSTEAVDTFKQRLFDRMETYCAQDAGVADEMSKLEEAEQQMEELPGGARASAMH
jgi:hypothetical protein